MPSTTSNIEPNTSSFLGLQFYTEAQSNSFFGRDAETDTLTSLIQLNTLTIVFGRSGTGKTSLLNAGVFPRLRKNFCLPFRIRLEFSEKSDDLISQVKKVLKEEIDKYGFKVESYPSTETLWEYFHKEPLWKTVTPILVFDQFEEIFTLAKSNPRFSLKELPAFWGELSDVIENNIPEKLKEKFLEQKEKIEYNYKKQKAKVVFSFREEYLPEFETIAAKIPSLKYSRFRLLPMNGNQAYEVITKTWKENICANEAKQLVSYFTNETGINDYSLVTVEPSLLSQVCAYIDKERIESGGGKISAELLSKYPKDAILRSIYDEGVNAANNSINIAPTGKGQRQNPIKEFIEEKLITTQGYRTKYHLTAHEDILKPGLYVLTARYLIREDDDVVELTHDVLAPLIKIDREKRRNEIAVEIARQKARKKAIRLIIGALLIAGSAFAIFSILSTRAYNSMVASNKKKEAADSAVQLLNKEITNLTHTRDSLRRKNLIKKGTEYLPANGLTGEADSLFIDSLQQKINRLSDSVSLLQTEIIGINGQIKDRDKRLKDITIKHENDKSAAAVKEQQLKTAINNLSQEIERYKRDSIAAATKTRELETTINNLRGQIRKLGETIKDLMNRNPGSTFPGNLRVQVYDKKGPEKSPIVNDTFHVYIIPFSRNNKSVLNNSKAQLYQKDCNGFGQLISKLSGWQQAYFKDGYYYFHDVIKNGKYKIKICNVLDGYFDLQMPSSSGSVFWKMNEKEKIEIKLGRF
jgi:hypothetical protein